MATTYTVKAPLVIAKTEAGADVYLYQGAVVPAGQSDDWVKRHLADEMIVKGEFVPDQTPPDDLPPAVEKPAGNASADAWHDYAISQGKTEADLDGLARDDIRALFPE